MDISTLSLKYIIGSIHVYIYIIKGSFHSLQGINFSTVSLKYTIGIVHGYSCLIKVFISLSL